MADIQNKINDALARERTAQAELMARKRSSGRDITIPHVVNMRRRRRGERDPEYFCRTYLRDTFSKPFTDDGRDLLYAIINKARHGGKQAIAAARGDGKTSIIKGAIIYCIIYGMLRYTIYVDKNYDDAKIRVGNIRFEFEENELLTEDFPEICYPVRALEGATNRANMQTVNGKRTRMKWGDELIIFPTIPGSLASGAILQPGPSSKLRGRNIRNQRPQFVVVDDIETPDSVKSETLTRDILNCVTKDIAGLAPPGESIAVIWPCTIMIKDCLSDRFTDPRQEPSWHGKRHKMIKKMPDCELDKDKEKHLWERFILLCEQDDFDGDDSHRTAHRFYLENRKIMDAGAIVANPYRFNPKQLTDGSQLEVSTLEHCYRFIAKWGWDSFNCEFQNDPPADEIPETDDITINHVMKSVNSLPEGVVPADCDYLTAFIDIHARHIDWVVMAYGSHKRHVVGYGQEPVNSPNGNLKEAHNLQGLQEAILTSLRDWRDRAAEGWPLSDNLNDRRYLDICLIDGGYQPDPVKAFVKETPGRTFRISKGEGSRKDEDSFNMPKKKSPDIKPGKAHWYASRDKKNRVWIYHLDADWNKRNVQQGFVMQDKNLFGAITLYGDSGIAHKNYAQHINAELWTEKYNPGKGWERWWDVKSRRNHWLDGTAGCLAGAIILGLPVVDVQSSPPTETKENGSAETPKKAATVPKPTTSPARQRRQRTRRPRTRRSR